MRKRSALAERRTGSAHRSRPGNWPDIRCPGLRPQLLPPRAGIASRRGVARRALERDEACLSAGANDGDAVTRDLERQNAAACAAYRLRDQMLLFRRREKDDASSATGAADLRRQGSTPV